MFRQVACLPLNNRSRKKKDIRQTPFPDDDTDIDIERVCSFYEGLQKQNCTNRQIAESAANDFAWKSIMKPIYEQLK